MAGNPILPWNVGPSPRLGRLDRTTKVSGQISGTVVRDTQTAREVLTDSNAPTRSTQTSREVLITDPIVHLRSTQTSREILTDSNAPVRLTQLVREILRDSAGIGGSRPVLFINT